MTFYEILLHMLQQYPSSKFDFYLFFKAYTNPVALDEGLGDHGFGQAGSRMSIDNVTVDDSRDLSDTDSDDIPTIPTGEITTLMREITISLPYMWRMGKAWMCRK